MGRKAMRVVQGSGFSPGVAIGRAVCVRSRAIEVYRIPIPEERIEEEIGRLRDAVERASAELETTRRKVGEELGEDLAEIFQAHALMLDDEAFLGRIEERIRAEKVNAEWGVHRTAEELEERFESLDSERHKERAEDLQDVAQYLMRWLRGSAHHDLSELAGDLVIVADDLTPSEAVRLGRQGVMAFAIERGGRTSHSTIIARSLHIPLVAGLSQVTEMVTDEDPVIVDGDEGRVILHPTRRVLTEHERRREEQREQELRLLRPTPELPSLSRDGVAVDLLANIDLPEEIEEAAELEAAGVGLYRSEFLYIEQSPRLPSEEEHVAIYRRLLERMRPRPVVIRTFDLGGRKLARDVMETGEENPVLGLRGIRLTLARPEIFRVQLRALLRAGTTGNLWIMVPMVSSLEEVQAFREFLARVTAELESEGLPFTRQFKLGLMIEVPSAALIADALAREVDFLSIGTNDLIQYAMAVDRNNEHVSYLYRPLHPAILRMIRHTVVSADAAGIDVSICGEMAGDRRAVPLLLGLGLRRLSISPRAIPVIKSCIRELSVEECRQFTERCLALSTAREVGELLDDFLSEAPEALAT